MLLVSVVVHALSAHLRDPTAIAGTVSNPAVVDHVYDEWMPAAWMDLRVLEHRANGLTMPEDGGLVLPNLVERVLPRAILAQRLDAAARELLAAVREERAAVIALGPTPDGWAQLPTALGSAFDELDRADLLVERVAAPTIQQHAAHVLAPIFGVAFTREDSVAAARRIFTDDWMRNQIVVIGLALVPFFDGTATDFAVVLETASRIPIAAAVLHDKLVRAHAEGRLVFDELLDPWIAARLAEHGPLPLGIELSSSELEPLLLGSVPSEWFAQRTGVLLDVLSAYLVGSSDELGFTIVLGDRKAALHALLVALVVEKLSMRLDPLPPCSRGRLWAATRDLQNVRLPECVPGSKEVVLGLATPKIESEIGAALGALPDAMTVTHDDVVTRLGPTRMATLDRLRNRVIAGLVWTRSELEDVLTRLAPPETASTVVSSLERVRSGLIVVDAQSWTPTGDDERRFAFALALLRSPWLGTLACVIAVVLVAWASPVRGLQRVRIAGVSTALAAVLSLALLWLVPIPAPSDVAGWLALDGDAWPKLSAAVRDGPVPETLAGFMQALRTQAAQLTAPWLLAAVVAVAVRPNCLERALDRLVPAPQPEVERRDGVGEEDSTERAPGARLTVRRVRRGLRRSPPRDG